MANAGRALYGRRSANLLPIGSANGDDTARRIKANLLLESGWVIASENPAHKRALPYALSVRGREIDTWLNQRRQNEAQQAGGDLTAEELATTLKVRAYFQ